MPEYPRISPLVGFQDLHLKMAQIVLKNNKKQNVIKKKKQKHLQLAAEWFFSKTSAVKHCYSKCGKIIFSALYNSDLFLQFLEERFVNRKLMHMSSFLQTK